MGFRIQVTKTKLLGGKLDHLVSWSDHIDHIVSMEGEFKGNVKFMFHLLS